MNPLQRIDDLTPEQRKAIAEVPRLLQRETVMPDQAPRLDERAVRPDGLKTGVRPVRESEIEQDIGDLQRTMIMRLDEIISELRRVTDIVESLLRG